MKRGFIFVLFLSLFVVSVSGCATGGRESILSGQRADMPTLQFVWVGQGTYFAFDEGDWKSDPSQDYEFLVRQNRFEDRWESLKIQNRIHSDYNGAAGPADQQHFFRVVYGLANNDGSLSFDLETTFGNGQGSIDARFERATMDFEAQGISSFAPYNRFRISQNYNYQEGLLTETVLLYKLTKDGDEIPFAKIEERATLFSPTDLEI
jgi:hypothetical protein